MMTNINEILYKLSESEINMANAFFKKYSKHEDLSTCTRCNNRKYGYN